MFSIYIHQPWGDVRWNYFNHNEASQVAGWNVFETTFSIDSRTEYPNKACAYFRGPARDIVTYLDEDTAILAADPDDYEINVS